MLRLTVSPVAFGVESLPGLPSAGLCIVVAMTLVETAGLLASRSKATRFAVLGNTISSAVLQNHFQTGGYYQGCNSHLVNRLDDPVDAGIAADGLVLGIN